MDVGYAVAKGAIQGLAEFLPVSSTAHLIFLDALSKHFGWFVLPKLVGEEEFFDIMLHVGTLVAVLIYFKSDLAHVLQVITRSQSIRTLPGTRIPAQRLLFYLALSMAFTIGFALLMLKGTGPLMQPLGLLSVGVDNIADWILANPRVVCIDLLITGILLFVTETVSGKNTITHNQTMRPQQAMIIGFAQGCSAVFHGLSRSGSTISTGLLSGLDRVTATRYSFLLSIPVIVIATLYEVLKLLKLGHLDRLDWPVMALGALVSGVIGYGCIKLFVQFVAKQSLKPFAIYCWAIGTLMLVWLS
jgi:undecaprenyl-diphosphatase